MVQLSLILLVDRRRDAIEILMPISTLPVIIHQNRQAVCRQCVGTEVAVAVAVAEWKKKKKPEKAKREKSYAVCHVICSLLHQSHRISLYSELYNSTRTPY